MNNKEKKEFLKTKSHKQWSSSYAKTVIALEDSQTLTPILGQQYLENPTYIHHLQYQVNKAITKSLGIRKKQIANEQLKMIRLLANKNGKRLHSMDSIYMSTRPFRMASHALWT